MTPPFRFKVEADDHRVKVSIFDRNHKQIGTVTISYISLEIGGKESTSIDLAVERTPGIEDSFPIEIAVP